MKISIVLVLSLATLASVLGTYYSLRPNITHSEEEGTFTIETPDSWWSKRRSLLLLGIGILLNTAAGFVSVFGVS
jgi:hypothetical protein